MNNPLQNHPRASHRGRAVRVSGHGPKNEPCIYRVMRGSLSADYDGSRALMPKQAGGGFGHGFRRKGGRFGIDRPELYATSIFSRQGVQH